MGKLEKISVIIPVYNTEKYLEKTVRSVMDQTYGNIEIICVNDGSTDGSLDILKRLQKEDGRIVIIDKKNEGQGYARNAGLDIVKSEWVSFIDSDDIIRPETYSVLSEAFAYNPDMVHFGVQMLADTDGEIRSTDDSYYRISYSGLVEMDDIVRKKSDASVCNKLFRKSIIDRYGIRFEKIYYEDFVFSIQYMLSVGNAYYVQDKLYGYLRHGGSTMAETFLRTPKAIDHVYAVDYIYEFMKRNNILLHHRSLFSRLFVDCYVFALKYSTMDKIPDVVSYATSLYRKYTFIHNKVIRLEEHGTILFRHFKKQRTSSRLLQKVFSIRLEWMDYKIYKVIRLFNMVVYRELRASV